MTQTLREDLPPVLEDLRQAVLNPSNSGRRPLTLLVSPVRSAQNDLVDLEAAALVLMGDPDREAAPLEETLRRLFNLTPAEARIVSELASGRRLEQIAKRLGVQVNTTRAHLKSAFAKTGTGRQTELVQLVERTVSSIDTGDPGA